MLIAEIIHLRAIGMLLEYSYGQISSTFLYIVTEINQFTSEFPAACQLKVIILQDCVNCWQIYNFTNLHTAKTDDGFKKICYFLFCILLVIPFHNICNLSSPLACCWNCSHLFSFSATLSFFFSKHSAEVPNAIFYVQ